MSLDWIPSKSAFFCTFLVWAITWSVYRANQYLHKVADPAWKMNNNDSEK